MYFVALHSLVLEDLVISIDSVGLYLKPSTWY